jgi:serine/threonine protein phosphatase PrpC
VVFTVLTDRKLAMSRAFGDHAIKEHLRVEPDISNSSLVYEDESFILTSDRLWKIMDNQEAV